MEYIYFFYENKTNFEILALLFFMLYLLRKNKKPKFKVVKPKKTKHNKTDNKKNVETDPYQEYIESLWEELKK